MRGKPLKIKIAIAGYSGAGKTSVSEIVAKELGIKHIRFSFKELAREFGMDLLEFQEKLASQDKNFDLELDRRIMESAKKAKYFVCSTWLGPWFTNPDLKVWLKASREVRARRIAKRDGMEFEEALEHVARRDQNNWMRYWRYYGIDLNKHDDFDLIINTEKWDERGVAHIIIEAAKKYVEVREHEGD